MAKTAFVAGAAALPISPLPEHLQGRLYLGGYDGYLGRPAAGLHDELFARALVIGDGAATLVIIALDLVGISNRHIARIRYTVARRLEVPEAAVLVAATHSHASPDLQGLWGGVSEEYAAHLRRQAVRTALQAAGERREATLRVASAEVGDRTVNRRGWPATDGTMTALQARDGHKDVIFTLVNFAAHPTVTQEENVEVSADFPGALVKALESDGGGVGIFVNADQGDSNPNVAGGFAEARAYGEALAGAAAGALKKAEELAPPLTVVSRDLDVPLANPRLKLPPGLLLRALLASLRGAAGLGVFRWLAGRYPKQDRAFVFAGLGLMAEHPVFVREGEPYLRTRVSRLRIGEGLDGLAAPGEVVTNLGLPLRRRLSAPATLFLGLTNDSLGYFVPPEEWMTGRNDNYEETVSLGPQAAPALERAVSELLAG